MERQSHGQAESANERSPLISSEEGSHNRAFDWSNEDTPFLPSGEESHIRALRDQLGASNVAAKGFTLRRCMILPMCFCYFLAGGVYIYAVPQYTQKVMRDKNIEDQHSDKPSRYVNSQSSGASSYDACSTVNQSDPDYQRYTRVQQETAIWTIYFSLASYVPAMFANLVWASYSDVIGRKISILLCIIGFFVRAVVFTLVVYYDLSLIFIVIGNIVDGLTGSFTSLFAMLFSYVSDITYPGHQRTIGIVVFELVMNLTVTIASLLSGPLIENVGYFYPGVGMSGLLLIAMVVLLFLVPETLQNTNTERDPCSAFKIISEAFRFYFNDGTSIKRVKYILLLLAFFFMAVGSMNKLSMEVLYQLGRPFCWSATKIGWFGAIKMAVSSLFGIVGAYLFKKCFSDDSIAFVSLVISAGAMVVEGLAKTDFVLYTVTVISAPQTLPFPMIRSLMSCLTPAEKQGAMFASVGFVETLCTLIGSVSTNVVYSATLTIMAGFVFLLMAGVILISAIFMLIFMVVQRKYKEFPVATTVIIDGIDEN